jgi:sporulation protein YlmC with PRC-barrel domain
VRFADIRGRVVVDRSTAREVGTVGALVVDPAEHRITSLDVDDGDGRLVGWDSIVGIGDGGVVVTSGDALRTPSATERERLARGHDLIGRRVLSSAGEAIGELDDIVFDARNGVVESLVANGSDVSGDRLRAIGSYAVIVN